MDIIGGIFLFILIIYGWCKAFGYGSSMVAVPTQKVSAKKMVPVGQISVVYDKIALYKQMDEYLGCTYTEYIWSDSKYRKRPDLKWFCTNFGATLLPSPAEQKIIDELVKYDIRWEREISFAGLSLVTGGWARYDIWLPDHNIVIEYHGKLWHTSDNRTSVDTIKEQFCKDNDINLVIWNSSDYYHIPARVQELMNKIHVSVKSTSTLSTC